MISLLRGVVHQTNPVILLCAGVGYGVKCTLADSAALVIGQEATLVIHETIKEDAHDLYGFMRNESKELFEQLLGVKNVGPKSALAVLDIGSENSVKSAIAGGDVKLIQTAKGVGKRAAEQIIVELRDKVGKVVGSEAENLVYRSGIPQNDEAFQALVALGYSEADAQRVLNDIDGSLPTQERIRLALKG